MRSPSIAWARPPREGLTWQSALCEVPSPCRGQRPHHVEKDRIGTWEVSCKKCAHHGKRPEGEIAMDFRTILVPIEEHDFMNSTLETALLLARKFDSYIEGFALRVAIPAAYAVADVGAVAIPQLAQDIAENAQRSQSRFENFMQEHGVPRRGAATALSSSWL